MKKERVKTKNNMNKDGNKRDNKRERYSYAYMRTCIHTRARAHTLIV